LKPARGQEDWSRPGKPGEILGAKDPGATYYEEKYREQAIKHLKRKAAKLGMQVVPAVS
jgi:hypothetical protein